MRRTLYLAHLYLGLSVGLLVVLVGSPEARSCIGRRSSAASRMVSRAANGETRPLNDLIANAGDLPLRETDLVSIQPPLAWMNRPWW